MIVLVVLMSFVEYAICPDDYVKCPGSYCIHSRFVCDGTSHCPGGSDESGCSKFKFDRKQFGEGLKIVLNIIMIINVT